MTKHGGNSEARPAALLLSPEAPFPAVGGGPLRTSSLVRYLARHCDLDLIVFREPAAPDPRAALPPGLLRHVHVIPLPVHGRQVLARAARNLGRLLRGVPPLNDRFAGFAAPVAEFLGGRRYDLAVIEHSWCAAYWEQVAPHADRVVLDLHNVESVLHRRCARTACFPVSLVFWRFHKACLAMERRWFPRFSLLLAASSVDAQHVRDIVPGVRVEVFPNTIPPVPRPDRPVEDVIVFSGNLEYYPNVAAVRFFRRKIWPLLRERWPGLRWRLVGKNPQAVRRYVRGDPRIELTGPVEDAIAELAAAKVVVVPLLAGSGTRFKILEAWAAGRPVVSTTVGAEGLPARDGENILLADTPVAFAAAVSSLLSKPGTVNPFPLFPETTLPFATLLGKPGTDGTVPNSAGSTRC
ncbi:MAG: glycosyltransferase [Acidobacteriota bacterium]